MTPIQHPPRSQRARRRQRGMAVISALLVVAAAAVASTAIIERQGTLARTLSSESDRTQAAWLLRGGLDWSRIILRWDARRNATTRPDAIWARPIIDLRVSAPNDPREASFTGRIEDEQSKYNLNNLAKDGVVLPAQQLILERLFDLLQLPQAMAARIAERVAAAQPTVQDAARAPALQSLNDLRGLEGASTTMLDTLRPYLTVLPSDTKINVNTASAEVLSASLEGLSLPDARATVIARDKGQWFNNAADFINRLNNPDITTSSHLDVASQWFRVAGEVALDHATVGLEALIQRKGRNDAPVVRWIKELH